LEYNKFVSKITNEIWDVKESPVYGSECHTGCYDLLEKASVVIAFYSNKTHENKTTTMIKGDKINITRFNRG
jgi:hypothetical protein